MPGGLGDLMARSQAAQGMMGAEGEAPPEMLPEGPGEAPPESESPDIEQGAQIIEAFAESIDPQTGDQIREHLNAIRELAANAAPMDQGPSPEETAATGAEPPPEQEPML